MTLRWKLETNLCFCFDWSEPSSPPFYVAYLGPSEGMLTLYTLTILRGKGARTDEKLQQQLHYWDFSSQFLQIQLWKPLAVVSFSHPLALHHSATLSGCCLLYLASIAYLPFRSLFFSLVCGCCIFTGNKAFCHTNKIPIDWGDAIGRVFLTVTLFDTSQQIHSLIAMIPAAAGGRLADL